MADDDKTNDTGDQKGDAKSAPVSKPPVGEDAAFKAMFRKHIDWVKTELDHRQMGMSAEDREKANP